MKKIFLAAALALPLAGVAADQAELLVYGQGNSIMMDVANTSGVTAFQAEIAIKAGSELPVELSGCVSGLPDSHTGSCTFRDGVLRIAVLSLSNAPLPAGSVGSIDLGVPAEMVKSVSVKKLAMASPQATEVPSAALVDLGNVVFSTEDLQK